MFVRHSALWFLLFAPIAASCGNEVGPQEVDDALAIAPADPSTEPDGDWLAGVQARIAASARAFHEIEGTWTADLRTVGLTARFDEGMVRLSDRDGGADGLGIGLAAWGRVGDLVAVGPVEPSEGQCTAEQDPAGDCIRRVELDRGGLTEWWVGLDDGVEQGFVVAHRPVGEGELAFEMLVEGVLDVRASSEEIAIADETGRSWNAGGVVAWDARGELLPSRIEADGDVLRVVVDDTGAVYPVEVDPIYTTAFWENVGSTSIRMGISLAIVGDVDKDGYNDIVVGAPDLAYEGRVYLFKGRSAAPSTMATATLEGESVSSYFGRAVAGAGDVNGDGYADVVVGAYGYDSSTGRTYIFQGGASGLSTTATTQLDGASASISFGYAVDGAGDVDNDGYDDVIVGAYAYSSSTGRAYLFRGSSTGLATTVTTTLTGSLTSGFGVAVAGAGDVNKDGYDDVIVGAPSVTSSTGQAYVFHGSSTGLSTTVASTLVGPSTSSSFGAAVDAAGDVNGDGYADVIVGAYRYSSYTGRAYVHHGSSAGISVSATTTLVGYATSNYFGFAVAGIGDVTLDGYDDVAVGAYGYSTDAGQVSVYSGSSAGTVSFGPQTFTGGASTNTGYALAGGDVDGDGYSDLLIGAPTYSFSAGSALLYHGSAAGLSTTLWTSFSPKFAYFTEPTVAGIGDYNADGYDDLAVGDDDYGGTWGIVHVFFGGATGPADFADVTMVGAGSGLYFGAQLSAAGDVNNDGYDDLLVSSPLWTSSTGVVQLHTGRASGFPTSSLSAATSLRGLSSFDYFGTSLTAMGDTNADGYDDVLIGAYGASAGEAYLYRGTSTGLSTTATTTLRGASGSDKFGYALAAGDFNSDGYPDAAVGAYGVTSSQGQVTVYHGSSSGLSTTATRTISGEATSNYFGRSLVGGDFDGDGYDDIVVSATGYDSGKGRVYEFDGGTSGISGSPSVTVTGATTTTALGTNMARALDVDGDGTDEVLLTVPGTSSAGGTVDVYKGSSAGIATSPSQTLTGTTSKPLKVAVGGGDIDGDGYGDLIMAGSQYVWLNRGYDVDTDGDGSADSVDCNDSDATVHPGATESCNGVDDDCDGSIDETSPTWYRDADSDGYGVSTTTTTSCTMPTGYVAASTDCDDTRSTVNPAATEACNSRDDDCDGTTDEDGATGATTWYADADADGYGDAASTRASCTMPTGYVATATDCRDSDAAAHPGATEYCDGVDDDCDGTVDENDASDASTWYIDADGDGYGVGTSTTKACSKPSGYSAVSTDCDDTTATVIGTTTYYRDADADGYGTSATTSSSCTMPSGYVANSTDCNDGSAAVSPAGTELCNAIDDDCDGATDEAAAADAATWYVDADADGFGGTATTKGCTKPSGYVATSTDCDDSKSAVSPAATELCNVIDDDCDGTVDESDASDAKTWYPDVDGDGYGDDAAPVKGCSAPSGTIALGGDCDDSLAVVSPDGTEACNGRDDDCDGALDNGFSTTTYYSDVDGDDYGDPSSPVDACVQPEDAVTDDTDCDDTDADSHPGAAEVWYDGRNQDCGDDDDFDADGDGQDSDSYGGDDCDDSDPDVYTGAPDDPYDGLITNCDNTNEFDGDEDGYLSDEHDGDDCDDARSDVHPGAEEVWYDGLDQDCDGNDDDQDGDGFGEEDDCDDENELVNPSATELWYDGVDQNCDGNDVDQDGDGAGFAGDCDDTDPAVIACPGSEDGGKCGCASNGGPATAWLVLVGALFARSRRR